MSPAPPEALFLHVNAWPAQSKSQHGWQRGAGLGAGGASDLAPACCVTSDAELHLSELQFPHLGSKGLELLLQETENSPPLHQEKATEFH